MKPLVLYKAVVIFWLKFKFSLRNGKVTTEDLVVVSPDFYVEGQGDVSLKGFLNYRLNAFFSPSLTKMIIVF